MMLNFHPSNHNQYGRSHPGVQLLMADGSVRFLKATTARLIVDREGNIVEIQADMVDTRTGSSWTLEILPYIGQDNTYSFKLRVGLVELQYNAIGHLLPMMPADRFAADRCLPDAGDVFRPEPRDRFGHIDGDAVNADGIWGLRLSPADQRRYFADHEPVLTDFTSNGFLKLAFPMTEVRTGSDQISQESIVEAMALVELDVIVYAGRPIAAVCMSLSRDGNVFAVWLTVGYFEVVDDTSGAPRLRFFAIVDRSQ